MKAWSYRLIVVALLSAGLALGLGIALAPSEAEAVEAPSAAVEPPVVEQGIADADRLSAAFEHVAERIGPSVASVRVLARDERPSAQSPFEGFPSPFFEFFGLDPLPRRGPGGERRTPQLRQGAGTGFVVSADGYLVTNHHVVRGAEEVEVTVDGRTYAAEVVGSDPMTDLAVLKIEAENLSSVRLGSSENLRVGQWVVAVGDPFGLTASITAGIVSAKGRSRVGLADYEDFIQTDAAINPGNSGGPLLNLRGEVVGVNTAIASRSGGYMGVGFAIPIDLAKTVVTSLIDEGRVVRGYLGVSIQDLDPGLAQSFGYDGGGALVGDVTEGSPADKAGLRSGDIVFEIDGREISDVDELRFLVAATKPQTTVELGVFRDRARKTVEVEIGELADGGTPRRAFGGGEEVAKLGIGYRTLNDEIARQLGYEVNPGGVVISAVEPLSTAARAGLRARDVVTEVDGIEIDDAADFRRRLSKNNLERGVRLTVLTQGTQRFVFLQADA